VAFLPPFQPSLISALRDLALHVTMLSKFCSFCFFDGLATPRQMSGAMENTMFEVPTLQTL
jgi:hypothetical protein